MKISEIFKTRKTRLPAMGLIVAVFVIPAAALITTAFCNNRWCQIFPWQNKTISGFEECVSLGYPVAESQPRRCLTPQGSFVENLEQPTGGIAESFYSEEIAVDTPLINALVTSPLEIKGKARGSWFFEASFPVSIVDANNNILGQWHAEALEDWMTTEFVPFKAELSFSASETKMGFLILSKDNPSGLPENDAEIRIPVLFTE